MNNAHGERLLPVAVLAGLNAVVSVGFAVATVAAERSDAAWYAADRAAALLVALAVVAALRNRIGLLVVGWMLTGVQAADALIGLSAGNASKTVGPLILAAATAAVLVRAQRARKGVLRHSPTS
jgi:hypothetical protein